MKKVVSVLTFFLILYIPYIVHAEMTDSIIGETEHIYVEGYSVSDTARNILSGKIEFTFAGIADRLISHLFREVKENLSVIIKLTAAGILSGIAWNLCGKRNDVGTLACVGVVSLYSMKVYTFALSIAEETIDAMFLFVQALMPPVVAAAAASGQAAQTVASGTVFAAMQVFIYVCKEMILPLTAVSVALGVVNHLGETAYLDGITKLLRQILKWGTGLLLTLYGAVVAIQAQTAGAFDTVAGKTVKYMVGSFVPVVGGALSESLELVGKSAWAIKNALGISGMIGVGYICITPLLKVCAVAIAYKLASCAVTLTAEKQISGAMEEIGSALMQILTVVVAVGVMFVISLAMLCRFGGGIL